MAFKITIHNKRTYLLLEIDTLFEGYLSGYKIRNDMSYHLKFLPNVADTRFYKNENFEVEKGKNWIRTSTGYLNWTTRDQIQLNLLTDENIYLTPLLNCPRPTHVIDWSLDDIDSDAHLFVEFLNMVYAESVTN